LESLRVIVPSKSVKKIKEGLVFMAGRVEEDIFEWLETRRILHKSIASLALFAWGILEQRKSYLQLLQDKERLGIEGEKCT
jgi:hypothetical protein